VSGDAAALSAVDRNLVSHATHLHDALPGGRVERIAGAVVADSGLDHDTFNLVCGAAPGPGDTAGTVRAVLDAVVGRGRPFAWWVPDDGRGVSAALGAAGRPAGERQSAMRARAADVPLVEPPDGARVETVRTPAALADYAHLLASLFSPYAEPVVAFHRLVATALLQRSARSRFVLATAGGMPLAGAELHHDGETAGLYGVVTAPIARGRGLGTAVSAAAIAQLGALGGAEHVVLQATAAGERVYRRLGFARVGGYVEHAV
jgi:GNAT superfamily N-acetyltransferase